MENELTFSFDDEVASKFCYDLDNRIISVHFTGYSNLITNDRIVDSNCILTISSWDDAKGKIYGIENYENIEKVIGIFSMILSIILIKNCLNLEVLTLDGKYINLLMYNSKLTFTHD